MAETATARPGRRRLAEAFPTMGSNNGAVKNGKSPDEPVTQLRPIPIRDNGEPLVPFLEYCPHLYWVPRHPVFAYRRFQLNRKSVAEKLCAAARALPSGIRLAVVEGWRPPRIQEQMHAATRERLRNEHPEWTPRQISRVANRFSAPMDRRVPPPHTTGGAVDVHLVDASGNPIDLQSPYDLMDPHGAPADAPNLSPTARNNRRILQEAMLSAGLTNYPAEWWHWSYGDQGWAYRGDHAEALYAAIEPSDLAGEDFSFRPHDEPGF